MKKLLPFVVLIFQAWAGIAQNGSRVWIGTETASNAMGCLLPIHLDFVVECLVFN
jgi:hypothetical protein